MKTAKTLAAILILSLLAACGGDDGSDDPTNRPAFCQSHPESCK